MRWVADVVLARSRLVIAIFAIVTLVLAVGLLRLRLDSSIEAMYPDGSQVTRLRSEVDATFGAGDLLVAVLQGDIFERDTLLALRRTTDDLGRLGVVRRATSAANAKRMQDDDGFLLIRDLVDPARLGQEDIASLRSFLATSELYGGNLLVNAAGSAATIALEVDPDADAQAVLGAVQDVLARDWPGPAHVAGGPQFEAAMHDIARRDLPLLCGLAALMILAMLALNFRSAIGTALPMLTVLVGLAWSMGALGWLGEHLTTLNIVAPVAILAVGSSFSLHLLGRYVFELGRGVAKRDAIHRAVSETGLGVLISGVAISAAMCTFFLSSMPTVRVLGLFTAGGVLATLLASLFLLPALLIRLPVPRHLPGAAGVGPIEVVLGRLARFVARHRWGVLAVTGVLLAAAAFGATRIVPDTAVLAYFRKDSPVRQSYDVVERTFGGASQLQVLITGDLNDPALLRAMLDFQQQAEQVDGVGSSASIATVLREIHKALTGDEGLPTTREAVAQELLVYQLSGDVRDLTQFVTLDSRQALVTLTTTSRSTQLLHRTFAGIRAVADRTLVGRAEVGYTGLSLLQLAIEEALLHDFLVSLTLAVALVIVIDGAVRSIRAALVTILALLVTIALQYGVLGYFGIPLDLATMLLGALAIGVGDYAIHLTVRYMEERRRGSSPEVGMERALVTSGRSILFTALTLGAGFASMTISDFVPIRTLGGLMTFTVASVGVMSLTLLPAACLIFLRNPRVPRSARLEVPHHA